MSDIHYYAGIYLTRSQGCVVLGSESGESRFQPPRIPPIGHEIFDIDQQKPLKTLKEMADLIYREAPAIDSLAIGCYGPFVSLAPKDGSPDVDVGRLHPHASDPPLKGVGLRAFFQKAFFELGHRGSLSVEVQTDANAIALGEAYLRGTNFNQVVVGLCVSEGVGGGFVSGRTIWNCALHPEFGLIHVRTHEEDPLRPPRGRNQHSGSLGELASTNAMFKRAAALKMSAKSMVDLLSITDSKIWTIEGYYIAQACLACTAMLAPHKIVISSPLVRNRQFLNAVRFSFSTLIEERRQAGPLFDYTELRDVDSFIEGPSTDVANGPGAAGALYMAARPRSRGEIVEMRNLG